MPAIFGHGHGGVAGFRVDVDVRLVVFDRFAGVGRVAFRQVDVLFFVMHFRVYAVAYIFEASGTASQCLNGPTIGVRRFCPENP